MSDVAYQLVKTQSGAIPMLTLVTPVTWCIQTKSGVLSSFKIWKPVSPANKKQKIRPILKVFLDDFNFYFLYIPRVASKNKSEIVAKQLCQQCRTISGLEFKDCRWYYSIFSRFTQFCIIFFDSKVHNWIKI